MSNGIIFSCPGFSLKGFVCPDPGLACPGLALVSGPKYPGSNGFIFSSLGFWLEGPVWPCPGLASFSLGPRYPVSIFSMFSCGLACPGLVSVVPGPKYSVPNSFISVCPAPLLADPFCPGLLLGESFCPGLWLADPFCPGLLLADSEDKALSRLCLSTLVGSKHH